MVLVLIHHNKKDGSMLIVKTVFANLSRPHEMIMEISCHINLLKIGCLFILVYSLIVVNKKKPTPIGKHRHVDFANRKVHILTEVVALLTKIFMGKKANLVISIWFVKYFLMFLQPI